MLVYKKRFMIQFNCDKEVTSMKKLTFICSLFLFILSGCIYTDSLGVSLDTLDISFVNQSDDLDNVTGDLILPNKFEEFDVTWKSSNESILSNNGEIVVTEIEEDLNVILTATVIKEGVALTKKFVLTIKTNTNEDPIDEEDLISIETQAFLTLLNSISEVNLNSKNQIEAARALFDSLDALKKQEVTSSDYLKLVTYESTLNSLLSSYEAAVVCDMISNITDGALINETSILNARTAYDNLSVNLKTEVSNYDRLLALEEELKSNKDIDFVEEKIAEIGSVDIDSQTKINIALAFYNNLDEIQKNKVSNKDVLFSAVSTYQDLITEFRVTFLDSDNTILKVESVKLNQNATAPVVNKTGYTFLGWSSNEYLNVVKDVSVKASYAITTYNITYNLNGGVLTNASYTYTILDEVVLKIPTKTNNTFLGWYTDSIFTHKVTSISVNSTGNKTFYAKWISNLDEFNITYNLNGGYWGFLSKAELTTAFFNDLKTYLGATESYNTFVHGAGLTTGFNGLWITDARYNTKIYKINSKLVNSDPYFINNATYNPKWIEFFNLIDEMVKQVNPAQSFWGELYVGRLRLKNYFAGETFNAAQLVRMPSYNGLIVSKIKYTDNVTLRIPVGTNKEFLGWSLTNNINTSNITSLTNITSNITVYAIWRNMQAVEVSLGIFEVTAYCPCAICCGEFNDGITFSGTVATAGRTIAVDPSEIAIGTQVIINGHTYVAEDIGSAIGGKDIDIYFDTHQEALNFGRQNLEVKIIQYQ